VPTIGRWRLSVPAADLTPGRHLLSLTSATSEPFLARSIQVQRGAESSTLVPQDILRYQYHSDLLALGVTGSFTLEKLGGFVMIGTRSQEIDLGHTRGGTLFFRLQNSGLVDGTVALRLKGKAQPALEAKLVPHERRDLRLTVPAGSRYVRLETQGTLDSNFLWGSPFFAAAPEIKGSTNASPTIVLISLDTTRRDFLGAYNPEVEFTPHLDELAGHATVFDQAYTTSPWTLPAHASLFTGLYPTRHGAGVVTDHLEASHPNLATLLRPQRLTIGVAGGSFLSFRFGLARGFGIFVDPDNADSPGRKVTDAALARVKLAQDLPLFLFAHYFDPHFPFRPSQNPEIRAKVDAAIDRLDESDRLKSALRGSGDDWQAVVGGKVKPSAAGLEALRLAYEAEIGSLDDEVGRLLAGLKAAGRYDEALIVVLSDHGELLGENGFFSHTSRLDSELIEIPLLVKQPFQDQARRVGRIASLVDVFPTLLLAAGLRPESAIDGRPLLAELTSPAARPREVLLEEHDTAFHRLYTNMKVADALFGIQKAETRRLVWDKNEQCLERGERGWHETPCELAPDRNLSLTRLKKQAHRPLVDQVGLPFEERARLAALGYLP
jgi:arylsulfatase A-like enzyme